jgi:hypothetical protein
MDRYRVDVSEFVYICKNKKSEIKKRYMDGDGGVLWRGRSGDVEGVYYGAADPVLLAPHLAGRERDSESERESGRERERERARARAHASERDRQRERERERERERASERERESARASERMRERKKGEREGELHRKL